MSIYVDPLFQWPTQSRLWCHMATDGSIEELHTFARSIGMKQAWFQSHKAHPHYDLTASKRIAAVAHGAIEVSSTELYRLCFSTRRRR
jgi:hypothetical protein